MYAGDVSHCAASLSIWRIFMKKIEELGINNLKIIQDSDMFCFGTDSVLLADFAKASSGCKVVDLCCGNGIIPILMSAKSNNVKFTGIEIQKESYDLANENIKINKLEDCMKMICDDIKSINNHIKKGSIDVVTCNPPYMSIGSGFVNPESHLAIARHEIKCCLDDVIKAVCNIIKFGGHFYMVHRSERLCDIIYKLRENKLEPKRICFVHPSQDKAPCLVLTESVYGAKPSLKFDKPLYVNI